MGVLDGKAVVVTGAGQGLGRAFAEHAAAAGASVVVNDIAGAEEVAAHIRASGATAIPGKQSVVDPDQAGELIDQCVNEFGAIDGLVNNAGLRHAVPPWEEEPGRIRALIEVNVLGPLYCGTAAAKAMHAQGSGAIVNIGSLSMLGQRGAGTYAASKGAVASMTVSWAVDLKEFGVHVNAICPLAWTRMTDADPMARTTREQTSARIAPLVTYLLSDLSADVTGQLIRFVGDKLHIAQQMAPKRPILVRDHWDVEDFAKVFHDDLVLEDFPATRWFP